MSDAMDPTVKHPDELLAGYVDGTSTPDDREAVDQHLATCATCREEVQLASDARAALISLPELGAPGLADAGVLALRRAAFQAVPAYQPDGATVAEAAPSAPTQAPAVPADLRSRRFRVAWAQLAAAAAIVVVLGSLVAIPLLRSGNEASEPSLGAATGPATASPSPLPPLIDQGASYSQATLDALAVRITAFARDSRLAENGTRGNALAKPTPAALPKTPSVEDSSAALDALTCLIQGGAPDNATLLYLEQAEVSGTPAYVGGFFIPGVKLNVMVVAVSREGCQPLYSVRQQT
jgi:anti-sigma factor RsiW